MSLLWTLASLASYFVLSIIFSKHYSIFDFHEHILVEYGCHISSLFIYLLIQKQWVSWLDHCRKSVLHAYVLQPFHASHQTPTMPCIFFSLSLNPQKLETNQRLNTATCNTLCTLTVWTRVGYRANSARLVRLTSHKVRLARLIYELELAHLARERE